MNPYLQVLAAADADRQSHYERAAVQTREHFARHPECRKIIINMDDDGYVTRGKGEIDVESRCRAGWLTQGMWKGNRYQADRPVEQQGAQPEAVHLSFSLRPGQPSNEITLRGHRTGDTEDTPLITRPGQAVNANEFMKRYLAVLHRKQSASKPASGSPVRPILKPIKAKINHDQPVTGFALVIQ